MVDTLPGHTALARRDGLDYGGCLQPILLDEVSRRDHGRPKLRLRAAGFEQIRWLEDFDWSDPILLGRTSSTPPSRRRMPATRL